MAYINVDEVYILDNTGLQVDMATDIPFVDAGFTDAQKAQARANIAAGGTNPNLLDNWWFKNPINQRGVTTITGTGQTYFIDRWVCYGDATLSTDGINIVRSGGAASMSTWIEEARFDLDSEYTISAILSDGTFYKATGTISTTNTGWYLKDGTADANGIAVRHQTRNGVNVQHFAMWDSDGTREFVAAKIEKGTVSTLLNDTPPNYVEELRKCQYYYREFNVTSQTGLMTGWAYANTGATFGNIFGIGNEMRTPNPTITWSGNWYIRTSNPTDVTVTNFTRGDGSTAFGIDAVVSSGLTANAPVRLSAMAGAKITFSCDL